MPHADLKYSNDLSIDAGALLREVEQIILTHDAGSGQCKGRAWPAEIFHHSHCLLDVAMLSKPHRDGAFTRGLLADLRAALGRHLAQPCAVSLGIRYMDDGYVTGQHVPER